MKLHLFSNDKSTAKDELIITIFALCSFILGVILIVFRPSFWIISSEIIICTGVMLVATAVVLVPSIIWRLSTNNSNHKTNEDNQKTQDN